MKRNNLFFLLGLLFVLAGSCHRDRDSSTDERLEGDWQLVQVSGGITGQGYTPPFDLLSFSDERYELRAGETVISDGTYAFDANVEHGLIFDPESSPSPAVGFEDQPKEVIFEGEDVLILADPCCDLYNYRFERVGSGDD